PQKIKTILNFWSIKNWIKRKFASYSMNQVTAYRLQAGNSLEQKMEKRHDLAGFVVDFLYQKSVQDNAIANIDKKVVRVEFSVHELKEAFENSLSSFGLAVTIAYVEDTLFSLSKIGAIHIEGGFMVVYNRLTIERKEKDNLKRYTKDDYRKLNQFYENKTQQIHIVGEYAKKMLNDYRGALEFVEDYFR